MKKTILITVLSIVVGTALYLSSPISACDAQAPPDDDPVLFAQAAVQAGFAAAALRLIEEGEIERAKQILEFQLARGLVRAGQLSGESRKLEAASPELEESLKRAKAYVQDHGLGPELEIAAEKAINFAGQGSDR